MMMLYRLVRLIENNSQALAACLLDRVQSSEATPDYKSVPPEELKERVYEIYRHLGDCLITSSIGRSTMLQSATSGWLQSTRSHKPQQERCDRERHKLWLGKLNTRRGCK